MLESEVSSAGFKSITGREAEGGLEGGGIGLPCKRGILCWSFIICSEYATHSTDQRFDSVM